MLAKTKLAKLEKELNELQARTTQRELTIDEVKQAIEQAEEIVKRVSPEFRHMFSLEYNPHSVSSSYNYRAEGTTLFANFNKSGKCINATVNRVSVSNDERMRIGLSYSSALDYIKNELLNPESYDTLSATEKSSLYKLVERATGASHHGYLYL